MGARVLQLEDVAGRAGTASITRGPTGTSGHMHGADLAPGDVEELCTWALPPVPAQHCLWDLFQASFPYGPILHGSESLWPVNTSKAGTIEHASRELPGYLAWSGLSSTKASLSRFPAAASKPPSSAFTPRNAHETTVPEAH